MTIIDVRSPEEFQGGHVEGSINIPLQEVPQRVDEFKSFAQPIILCCASGNRSGQAVHYLHNQGIPCENGGGWQDVEESMEFRIMNLELRMMDCPTTIIHSTFYILNNKFFI